MNEKEFKKQASENGLEAVRCSEFHYQLRGGRWLVNFYPSTRRIYVRGMHKSFRGDYRKAIATALSESLMPANAKQRTNNINKKVWSKRVKNKGFSTALCHWCKCEIQRKDATVDHIIPISKGGSDGDDNLVLACFFCNSIRGSSMPERDGFLVLRKPKTAREAISKGWKVRCPFDFIKEFDKWFNWYVRVYA